LQERIDELIGNYKEKIKDLMHLYLKSKALQTQMSFDTATL